MTKRFLITIGIMGFLSVLLGAVGAHILKGHLSEQHMLIFYTANEYIMFHALALLGVLVMKRNVSTSYINAIYYFFVIGVLLFSGTLVISSLKDLFRIESPSISFLAPIGGAMLLLGWLTMIFAGISYKHKKSHHQ